MNPFSRNMRPRVYQPLPQPHTDTRNIYRPGLVYPNPIRVVNRDQLLRPKEWF
jgi:hypothetical protein